MLNYFVNKTIVLGLDRGQNAVALDVLLDLIKRLAAVLSDQL